VPKKKPDPAIYLLAAKELGVEPARCCVVEDSGIGLKAAKAAGMRWGAAASVDEVVCTCGVAILHQAASNREAHVSMRGTCTHDLQGFANPLYLVPTHTSI
jgi:beta-phosphoglucomutase-like phosphatase (HAD superfamily)